MDSDVEQKQADSFLKVEASVLYAILVPECKSVWHHISEDLSTDTHLHENFTS